MNPDTTIRTGDRVHVREVVAGYGQMYRGKPAKVVRIETRPSAASLYDSLYGSRTRFGYYDRPLHHDATSVRYLVEMEGVRREQVYASKVEKIQEPVVRPGDRVRIEEGWVGGTSAGVAGHVGELIRSAYRVGRTQYVVDVPGDGRKLAARVTKVEPAPEYEPATADRGDRVVVLRAKVAEHVGRIGRVSTVREPGKAGGDTVPRVYVVYTADGGPLIEATKVSKVAEPASAASIGPVTHVHTATYTAPTPAPVVQIDGTDVYLDPRRLQAAQAAHRILFQDSKDSEVDVTLDDLIGTAEFLLGERTLGTATTGTVGVPPQRFLTGAAPATKPEPLTVRDVDGDELTAKVSTTSGQETEVGVNGQIAYVTGRDLDALIQTLTQARDYLRRAA